VARVRAFEEAQFSALDRLAKLRAAQADSLAADELIAACIRRGWPDLHVRAAALRGDIARDVARRPSVEDRHTALQEQYDRLAKDTGGEIIKAARLVATALARSRLVKAVLDGPYDVVLIDEVGAATLPEVLLTVVKASKCAVLLGDFMQLGPSCHAALRTATGLTSDAGSSPTRSGIAALLPWPRQFAISPFWCSIRSIASGRT
jgi:hypothetical protein